MNPPRLIFEEEEGETVLTIMPTACTKFECQVSGKDRRLVTRKGFLVCPVCGGSYGIANPKPKK